MGFFVIVCSYSEPYRMNIGRGYPSILYFVRYLYSNTSQNYSGIFKLSTLMEISDRNMLSFVFVVSLIKIISYSRLNVIRLESVTLFAKPLLLHNSTRIVPS